MEQVFILSGGEKILGSLYEQMSFTLSGGALRSLTEYLTPKISAALIVAPKGEDLEIVDAVGTKTDGLFLKGWAPKLNYIFRDRTKGKKFEVRVAPIDSISIGAVSADGEWQWAVAILGRSWAFYILLRESPDAIIAELTPIAGLIALWQEHKYMEAAEERLSHMAYMILATKSSLPSIFEPMPLDYYASFLADVLNESLFPRSLSIFKDDGAALVTIHGKGQPPERKGIYAKGMLPPSPIVTKSDDPPYEVTLPVVEPNRLFCVTTWDKMPEKETLDFLELIGNLASRAMTINKLRAENITEKNRIFSGEYTIFALGETLNALMSTKTRQELLSMTADIFTEISKVGECLIVAWDETRYAPLDYRKGSIRKACEPLHEGAASAKTGKAAKVFSDSEPQFFDLTAREFSSLLECPWPEMANMKLAIPFWNKGCMEGFAAVSSACSSLKDGEALSALKIVAQFTALALKNFE